MPGSWNSVTVLKRLGAKLNRRIVDWLSPFELNRRHSVQIQTGALRVGDSRVLLEIVVRAFQDGATPETIVQRYSTLALPDVYAVLAYYLRHPGEVDEYLARREEKAEEVQQRIESQQGDLAESALACSPSGGCEVKTCCGCWPMITSTATSLEFEEYEDRH